MGAVIGDRELCQFRREYYELFSVLFLREPTAELLTLLGQNLKARIEAAGTLHPLLGEGWREVGQFLGAGLENPRDLAAKVAEEFTPLLVGPGIPKLTPCESFYLTGKLFGAPLVLIRNFMRRVGIEKEEKWPEPEDHIAFTCDVMRQLITRQSASNNPDEETRWLNLQGDFAKVHLSRWVPRFAEDLEQMGGEFYRGIGKIVRAFLELEKELLADWGSERPAHLIQVKESSFKGPLFEAETAEEPEEEPPSSPP
ncbi:MAG: molecular chaperone TorD family protein [candidate division NC10 bacterium]